MKLGLKMSVGRLRQNLYSSAFCHVISAMKLSQKMSVGRLRQNLYSSAFCHDTSAMKLSPKMSGAPTAKSIFKCILSCYKCHEDQSKNE
jgi:hypothetical protein